MANTLDLQGLLRACYDPTNQALRTVGATEDISFSPPEMTSTATLTTTSSFPRFTLPDAATTSVFVGAFNFPNWWQSVDIHYGWSNDHTATGNVRIRVILKEVDAAAESLSAGATIADSSNTHSSGAANGGSMLAIGVASVALTRGAFGSFYGLELQRVGADAADTLAGPMGLLAIGFSRTG